MPPLSLQICATLISRRRGNYGPPRICATDGISLCPRRAAHVTFARRMDTISLGTTSIQVSRLAYGCWRILGPEGTEPNTEREANGRKAIMAAYEAGFTFFDHADVYADGAAEKVFGDLLKQISGM